MLIGYKNMKYNSYSLNYEKCLNTVYCGFCINMHQYLAQYTLFKQKTKTKNISFELSVCISILIYLLLMVLNHSVYKDG